MNDPTVEDTNPPAPRLRHGLLLLLVLAVFASLARDRVASAVFSGLTLAAAACVLAVWLSEPSADLRDRGNPATIRLASAGVATLLALFFIVLVLIWISSFFR
jgi:chromate transport protein ChrA